MPRAIVAWRGPTKKRDLVLSTFEQLGVMPAIVEALRANGITDAFPIQEMTLPIALTGTDLIGQARTGTGKTLAFSIPVLQRVVAPGDPDFAELAAPGKPQALVIAPTRELALQVAGDLRLAGANRGTRTLTVYGGVPYEPQLDALQTGVDIVVGTPGRLLDLADRRSLDLSHVKVLVLDEADEMLDLGFLPDVERLIAKTPELRQSMLFSATMRGEVIGLARTHMRHPVNIRAESASDAEMVPLTAQFVYQVHDLDKTEIIARVLQAENSGLSLVFTRTKRAAQRVAEDLMDRGFPAAPLHGDMPQVARERALKRFRDGTVEILVATDVAARGIDVAGITHVINYSCPEDEKTYIHRTGRTGRAGATGSAITFVDWADLTRWKVINRMLELPFDEPNEIYSTSEQLFRDHGISPGTKGRVGSPAPRDDAGKVDAPGGVRGGGRSRTGSGKGRDSGSGRSRSGSRQRTRTRSGDKVSSAGQDQVGEDKAAAAETSPDGSESAPGTGGTGSRRRRRSGSRNRTRSGTPTSD